MSEQSNDQTDATDKPPPSEERRRWARPMFVSLIVLVIIAAVAVWLLWPRQAGKHVAAPRSVSFDESPQPATARGETLTLTPEQMRTVQLKIETVGERPSSEAAGQMATGVVQANTYKETPVVSRSSRTNGNRRGPGKYI